MLVDAGLHAREVATYSESQRERATSASFSGDKTEPLQRHHGSDEGCAVEIWLRLRSNLMKAIVGLLRAATRMGLFDPETLMATAAAEAKETLAASHFGGGYLSSSGLGSGTPSSNVSNQAAAASLSPTKKAVNFKLEPPSSTNKKASTPTRATTKQQLGGSSSFARRIGGAFFFLFFLPIFLFF